MPTPRVRRPRTDRQADAASRGVARRRRADSARRAGDDARLSPRRIIGLVLGAVVFAAPLALDVPGLDDLGERIPGSRTCTRRWAAPA